MILLPIDTLQRVFSFLNLRTLCRCRSINHQLSSKVNESLATRSKLIVPDGMSDHGLFSVLKLMGGILHCNMANCWRVTNGAFKPLSTLCCNLTELNVSGMDHIASRALETLFASCTALTQLTANDCLVEAATLECIVAHCSQLAHLSVKGTDLVDDDLAPLTPLMPQLQTFAITMHQRTGPSVVLNRLLQSASSLETLDLSGIYHAEVRGNLAQAVIDSIAQCGASTLKHLNLSGNMRQDVAASIQGLLVSCTNLQTLDISQIHETNHTTLCTTLQPHLALRTLKMASTFPLRTAPGQAASDVLLPMLTRWPNLTSLDVSRALHLTPVAGPIGVIAAACPSLTHLNISASHAPSALKISLGRIPEEDFDALQSLGHIKYLGIGGYPSLSARAIARIAAGLPDLVKLNVSCSACTVAGLEDLLRKCTRLEMINVNNCQGLRATSLSVFAGASCRLRRVLAKDLPWADAAASATTASRETTAPARPSPEPSVSCGAPQAQVPRDNAQGSQLCKSVTVLDIGKLWSKVPPSTVHLPEVLRLFPQLEVLTLSGWAGLTASVFQSVVETCPQLSRILLNFCADLDADAVLSLVRQAQKLEEVQVYKSNTAAVQGLKGLVLEAARPILVLDFLKHTHRTVSPQEYEV